MRRRLMFGLLFVVLTACGSREPAYTDNGNPGQIKAVFFYDENRNGKMEAGEAPVQAEAIVAIGQEISCPPQGDLTFLDTDASGLYEFSDLAPGKYCLALNSDYLPTTKMTHEVYVSSDQVTTVLFGIVSEE